MVFLGARRSSRRLGTWVWRENDALGTYSYMWEEGERYSSGYERAVYISPALRMHTLHVVYWPHPFIDKFQKLRKKVRKTPLWPVHLFREQSPSFFILARRVGV